MTAPAGRARMTWPTRFWNWLGDPWTQAERDDENGQIAEASALGGGTSPHVQNLRTGLHSRRRALRLLVVIIVLVVVAAFLTAFYPSNRLVRGITAAAIASAAPVALYLGLRRR
jgi:hypothetical protein